MVQSSIKSSQAQRRTYAHNTTTIAGLSRDGQIVSVEEFAMCSQLGILVGESERPPRVAGILILYYHGDYGEPSGPRGYSEFKKIPIVGQNCRFFAL